MSIFTEDAKSLIMVAAAAISSVVSPFIRIATRNAAICTSDISPLIIASMILLMVSKGRLVPSVTAFIETLISTSIIIS